MDILSFIGSMFGYVLWFAFKLLNNYGLAIILFTVFLRALMFPMSIKQQKSMAANARLSIKQQDLQKKYGNDRERYNAELQKLYEREGVNPAGGCFTSFVPMILMLGVYYSVIYPLTNMFHMDLSSVSNAINYVNNLPGMGISAAGMYRYEQIQFITSFLKLDSATIANLGLSADQISTLTHFAQSFNIFGNFNLLETPSNYGVFSVYFLIPVFCFLSSVLSSLITMRIQNPNGANSQPGCMKFMFIALPLFSAYIAYSVPCAVGFYWICSTIIGFFTTLILNKFYNADILTAKQEAQHIVLLEQQETSIK